ncbi:MAG: DUF3089 domain-containing protein [Janthinobacterium lividum]
MLARRFLWIIAILVIVVLGAALAYRLFGQQLLSAALVPPISYAQSPRAAGPNYAKTGAWDANPALPTDAARWTPPGFVAAPHPQVAVFYVTPTAYLGRDRWTMPFDDAATNARIGMYLRSQATVFNGVGAIWAPKYRQASFGAFLTARPDAAQALDLAYGDVLRAFDAFVAAAPADAPIILAGHSQGSLHLLRLLQDRVAGKPLAKRIVAVYAVGWPISLSADLPKLGLPACAAAAATGCILDWQSFAEPADYAAIRARFDAAPSLTGAKRAGTRLLCTNPLLGRPAAAAVAAERNIGALVPAADLGSATVEPRRLGARCLASGIVSIGEPPAGFGQYVLPGNNYHVYDYPLFWANIRADAEARVNAFAAQSRPGLSSRPAGSDAQSSEDE